jgi:hypothetical protein
MQGDSVTADGVAPATTWVSCIAGRGPLDEQAFTMLAQWLERKALASGIVPHAVTGRGANRTLDVSGVAMVRTFDVAMTCNPSGLRFLMRQLRGRLPRDVPALVGF